MRRYFPRLRGKLTLGLLVFSATAAANDHMQDSQVANKGSYFNSGIVTGRVFEDTNANGLLDRSERGQAGVVVYFDANNNGERDEGEMSTTTRHSGRYIFFNAPAGDQTLRQEVPFGFRDTAVIRSPIGNEVAERVSNLFTPGDAAEENEYPFFAAVGKLVQFGEAPPFFINSCSGALLTDRWVITTAECTFVDFGPDAKFAVAVGANSPFSEEAVDMLEVDQIIVHPDFVPFDPGSEGPSAGPAGFDVALLRLENPVNLENGKIETISMLRQNDTVLEEEGRLATALISELFEGRELVDFHVPIANTQDCETTYLEQSPGGIDNFDTQICLASSPRSTCGLGFGNTRGFPMIVRDLEGPQWRLAGLSSYQASCPTPEPVLPGVYSRISALSEWARDNARDVSSAQALTVRPRRVTRANFGNASSTLNVDREIDPRWQLLGLEVIPTAMGTDFSWNIIDEAEEPREFTCISDPDGPGPLLEESVACSAGEDTFQYLHSPFSDGIFFRSFTAMDESATFTSDTIDTIGTPPSNSLEGELSTTDAINPDLFPSMFFIDYYSFENIDFTRPIKVTVEFEEASLPELAVYDRDLREAQGFGGALFSSDFLFDLSTSVQLVFFPEPGINYVLGVSSEDFGEPVVGPYTLTVTNNSEVVETTLSIDPGTSESAVDFSRTDAFSRDIQMQSGLQLQKFQNYTRNISKVPLR